MARRLASNSRAQPGQTVHETCIMWPGLGFGSQHFVEIAPGVVRTEQAPGPVGREGGWICDGWHGFSR